ncbi:MAG TPA: alpha/beta hydrolase, partial [Baekduia sp.]|nr:alpha/beta hydrolase [Baekduia sp.]
GYDYGLEQARDGHASVVVDRLGYPASAGPDGNAVCYGSQADVLDQVVDALRAGTYRAGDAAGPGFRRVALAGHSAGGFIAEMTQYSFASADALAVLGYSDSFASPLVIQTLTAASARCVTAPDRAAGEGTPANYAYFGQTESDFRAGHVVDADERVVAEALVKRPRDPCGDLLSIPPSFAANQPFVRTISSPVLLVLGRQDAFFPPPAGALQSGFGFSGSEDVSYVELPGTGHGLTLGRTHDRFRAAMHAWLTARGF